MNNTLYFKDLNQKDENNKSQTIYRIEDNKMFFRNY